ncbi:LexA family transcriptional regulator [Escherichia coli]
MGVFFPKKGGFPPNQQGGATMLGYRSVNAAVEHLRALEKKGVITIKRGVARGITLHTAVKDDDSEAVGIIRSLLAGEENARLRAAYWLHERGLKV